MSDNDSEANSRPKTFRMAAYCIGSSWLLGVPKMIYLRQQRRPLDLHDDLFATIAYFLLLGLFVLLLLWAARCIYRGRKLAFWLWMLVAALAVFGAGRQYRMFLEFSHAWEKGLFLIQTALQGTATIMLLLPISVRWINRKQHDFSKL